ncbi:MAG: hypothetical protein WD225_01875 [Ilumatobacteraceae bacterium]
MRSVPSVVAPVAHELIEIDLPHLTPARRGLVVDFVCRRIEGLPDVTRLAVLIVAVGYRGLLAAPGGTTLVRAVAARSLPLIGEYPRLIRSLATAHVWETWPDTSPDGRDGSDDRSRSPVETP